MPDQTPDQPLALIDPWAGLSAVTRELVQAAAASMMAISQRDQIIAERDQIIAERDAEIRGMRARLEGYEAQR